MDLFPEIIYRETGERITPEYRFHSDRRWRIDYAIVPQKIAIEVEGGAYTQGRHTRGKGFIADMEKYNALTAAGWRLIRVTPQQLITVKTIEMIKDLINADQTIK